jgi:hypothetical protein
MRRLIACLALVLATAPLTATPLPAVAQTRVTLKSATAGSSYYLMMVQLGEALKSASSGDLSPTIEESQGSVQNVKEAARRSGNFVFTTPPGLVRDARGDPVEAHGGAGALRSNPSRRRTRMPKAGGERAFRCAASRRVSDLSRAGNF